MAGRLARWSLTLQEYDITIRYRSGKIHDNADCLSMYPVDMPGKEEEDERDEIINNVAEPAKKENIGEEQRKEDRWRKIIEKIKGG